MQVRSLYGLMRGGGVISVHEALNVAQSFQIAQLRLPKLVRLRLENVCRGSFLTVHMGVNLAIRMTLDRIMIHG